MVLQYLPPGVIALVNFLGPLLFVSLIQLENYPPNTEVNLTLVWCVVLKLASLGMFSFSLGQTVLCLGRNKTSCASYGYNACDYQVAGGSIQACPARPSPGSPLCVGSTPPGGSFTAHRARSLWGFPAWISPWRPGF